jgi:magnesium transporter
VTQAPEATGPSEHSPGERRRSYPQRQADAVVGDCGIYEGGRRLPGRIPLEKAGAAVRATDGFVWIGLQQPTAEDIAEVAEEFSLPPLAVEDAVKAHQRPKLEVDAGVAFAVLKPVQYVDSHEIVTVTEIMLFLGPRFVVTVRHGDSAILRRVREELDREANDLLAFGPTAVLYRAADLVVDGYEEAVEFNNDDVDDIEAQVFAPGEDDHAERIYKLKREIAEFRHAVVPLARPLERLASGRISLIDKASAPYFRDVHDHVLRVADSIERLDRLLTDVLQANVARVTVGQSKISLRQNEDVRKISAWAAIALVPTAIAGIYGMNFDNMPELRWKYGYFLVLGVIAAVCFALHRLFRRNGWL